jgi:hypothetical protein
VLPPRIEVIFNDIWHLPKCNTSRWAKDLLAATCRNGEDRSGLSEEVRPGESSA